MASTLQDDLFSSENPSYFNFGILGWLIGHEITHGFDGSGSEYDKDGNVEDWWQKETRQNFENRTKCFIRQYASYPIAGIRNTVPLVHTYID